MTWRLTGSVLRLDAGGERSRSSTVCARSSSPTSTPPAGHDHARRRTLSGRRADDGAGGRGPLRGDGDRVDTYPTAEPLTPAPAPSLGVSAQRLCATAAPRLVPVWHFRQLESGHGSARSLPFSRAQMVRLVPFLSHAAGGSGRRVRLALVAPHFDEAILPTLTGRLAGAVPGYFGVLRYLVELAAPLPARFDPLGEFPWFARARRVRYVLVTPAPDAPTLETPRTSSARRWRRAARPRLHLRGPTARALRADAVRATAETVPVPLHG